MDTPGNLIRTLAIFLSGFIFALIATFITLNEIKARSSARFLMECLETEMSISNRLYGYTQMLKSGTSFFAASDSVTRIDWKVFFESEGMTDNMPGVLGIGYYKLIMREEVNAHVRRIRAEGFPEYEIKPYFEKDYYAPLIFTTPLNEGSRKALGFDMSYMSVRRTAMEIARDSGMLTMSGMVDLFRNGENGGPGVVLFAPVYRHNSSFVTVEERRNAIEGWIGVPVHIADFMNGLFGRRDILNSKKLGLKIYDGTIISDSTLMYDSYKYSDHNVIPPAGLTNTIPFSFNGKVWSMCFSKNDPRQFPYEGNLVLIFIGWIVISLLLIFLSVTLVYTRINAKKIANALLSELKESEKKYRNLVTRIPIGIYQMRSTPELTSTFEYMSPRVAEILDSAPGSFILDPNKAFEPIHPEDLQSLIDINRERFRDPKPFFWEGRAIVKGNIKWIRIASTPEKQKNGDILWNGVISDITEQKSVEEILRIKNMELQQYVAEKDKFFSIISHDLRSPFNGFLGLTQIMAEELPNLTMG